MERESGEMERGDGENGIQIEGLWDDWKEMGRNGSHLSDKDAAMRERLLMKMMNITLQIAIMGANVCHIKILDYE